MKKILTFIMLVLSMSTAVAVRIENINIRDPFILNDNGVYYMYSTKDTTDSNGNIRGGVAVYMSEDMKDWHGPNRVMSISDDNALKGTVWAPEVHKYNGKYYLFATINSDLKWKQSNDGEPDYVFRGTQIFFSDSPTGPFKSFGRFPHTR
ncbi:family 43 glycosylhydrolase, partial [Bacteroides acidifaciens]|uniref:family 43 glycosylhydrolase n=5 Tax=Bacteroidales TaxID=171549 RepID=UPI0025B55F53